MIITLKQWESKYIREFEQVKSGEVTEEYIYSKITAMYYNFISKNEIEPFTISYGRGQGFCINTNSHVGVIIHEDIVLYIMSMIPDLSLGKILYLQSQAEEVSSDSTTKQVLLDSLNNEEALAAVDYFVVSLVNVIEDIKQNGLISELVTCKEENNRLVGRLDLSHQIERHPSYDKFCVERTISTTNIIPNKILKTAVAKSKEVTNLLWIVPILSDIEEYLCDVEIIENVEANEFPNISEFTSIKREDYDKALRFSKYILLGYDPFAGDNVSFFPEFMLDMNQVFEYYVTVGLKKIFKFGFENKKQFTLGVGPDDIPLERKFIELDGFYENNDKRVVLDTKNKYRRVLDRDVPDFIASNPDIFQQYYYASRTNANDIILVYPSSRKRSSPIGNYYLQFENNKRVDLYFWALFITGTPRENKNALIKLAQFIDEI